MKLLAKGAAAAAAATVLLAGSANAAVIYSFEPGLDAPRAPDTLLYDFTDGSLAFLDSSTLTIIQSVTNGDGAQNPFSDPGGNYMSVKGGGKAVLTFDSIMSSISFNWGSLDTYNTLTIHAKSGNTIVIPSPANGNQQQPGTNGRFYAIAGAGDYITGLTFESADNSFEVDDISGLSAVPEPATWAMMISGFGLAGAAIRRRRTTFAAA